MRPRSYVAINVKNTGRGKERVRGGRVVGKLCKYRTHVKKYHNKVNATKKGRQRKGFFPIAGETHVAIFPIYKEECLSLPSLGHEDC